MSNKLNLKKISLVNPKHSEVISNNVENLVQIIKTHVYETYKNLSDDKALNLEFIKFLCCALESSDIQQSQNPVYKIDKKKIIVKLMVSFFPHKNNADYVELVEQFVQFLHNNEMIKSSSVVKQIKTTVINSIAKKCLGI